MSASIISSSVGCEQCCGPSVISQMSAARDSFRLRHQPQRARVELFIEQNCSLPSCWVKSCDFLFEIASLLRFLIFCFSGLILFVRVQKILGAGIAQWECRRGYELDGAGFESRTVQIGCGAHLVSYSMGTGVLSGGKVAGAWRLPVVSTS